LIFVGYMDDIVVSSVTYLRVNEIYAKHFQIAICWYCSYKADR